MKIRDNQGLREWYLCRRDVGRSADELTLQEDYLRWSLSE